MKLKSHIGKISVLLGIAFLVPLGESDLITNLKFGGSIIGFGLGIYAIKLKQLISGILGMLLNTISVLFLVLILGLLSIFTGVVTSDDTKTVVQDSVNQATKNLQAQNEPNDSGTGVFSIPTPPAAPSAPAAESSGQEPVAQAKDSQEQNEPNNAGAGVFSIPTPPPAPGIVLEVPAIEPVKPEAAPQSPPEITEVKSAPPPPPPPALAASEGVDAAADKKVKSCATSGSLTFEDTSSVKEAANSPVAKLVKAKRHYQSTAFTAQLWKEYNGRCINDKGSAMDRIKQAAPSAKIYHGDDIKFAESPNNLPAKVVTLYDNPEHPGIEVIAFIDTGNSYLMTGMYASDAAGVKAAWPTFYRALRKAVYKEHLQYEQEAK